MFSVQSRLALDGTSLEGNAASSGGALFAAGGTVNVTNSRLCNNTAASGGAALLSGGATLSAVGADFDGNAATFAGALMLVDRSSAVLSSCSASMNDAAANGGAFFLGPDASIVPRSAVIVGNHAAGGGGVVFTQGSQAQALAFASDPAVVNNSADNWGPVAATDSYSVELMVPRSARPGASLPATVTIRDGYGQKVNGLNESFIVVSCPDTPSAITSQFVNSYGSSGSAVTGLALSGIPGSTFQIQFTVSARDLPEPLIALANITVAECGTLEVRLRPRRASVLEQLPLLCSAALPTHALRPDPLLRYHLSSPASARATTGANVHPAGSADAPEGFMLSRCWPPGLLVPAAGRAPSSAPCVRTGCSSSPTASGTAGASEDDPMRRPCDCYAAVLVPL